MLKSNEYYCKLWHEAIKEQIDIYNTILSGDYVNKCALCRVDVKLTTEYGTQHCKLCIWNILHNEGTPSPIKCLEWLDNQIGKYNDFIALKWGAVSGDERAKAIISNRIELLKEWDKQLDSIDFEEIYRKLLKKGE